MYFSHETLPESVKNITAEEKWSNSQKDFFLTCANLSLEAGETEDAAISKGLESARHLMNASKAPKVFYCRHMEPGIAGYANEKVFMNADTMKRIMPTFAGKPVFVQHKSLTEIERLRDKPDGYVVDTFYNDLDGGAWSKILAISDAAHQVIENGYMVSNAFVGRKFGPAGRHIGIDFDREILDAEFTHLALVTNPRYKNSRVYTPEQFKEYQARKRTELDQVLNNDDIKKQSEGKMAFKLFNKEKKEVTSADSVDENTVVQFENNEEVSIKDMVDAVKAKKLADAAKATKEEEEQLVNEDTEIEVDGEKMTIKALKESYTAIKEEQKLNSDDEIKKAKEKKKEKSKEEEHLKNSDNFKKLSEAGKGKSGDETMTIRTLSDQVASGKSKYGSK